VSCCNGRKPDVSSSGCSMGAIQAVQRPRKSKSVRVTADRSWRFKMNTDQTKGTWKQFVGKAPRHDQPRARAAVRHRRGRRDETIISFRTKDDPIVAGLVRCWSPARVEVDAGKSRRPAEGDRGLWQGPDPRFCPRRSGPTDPGGDGRLAAYHSIPGLRHRRHGQRTSQRRRGGLDFAGTLRRSALMAPPYRCLRTPAFGPPPDRDLTSNPRDGRAGFSL
jgi:hypothetical protein